MTNNRRQLIYIACLGHSGSTLLGLILGAHSSIVYGGEFKKFNNYILQDYVRKDDGICTCGSFSNDCTYWRAVRGRLEVAIEDRPIDLTTHRPKHRKTKRCPVCQQSQTACNTRFEHNNVALIDAMRHAANKEIVCDSSRSLSRCMALLNCPQLDVTVVHLVRDGRAVAYSKKLKGDDYFHRLQKWGKNNIAYGNLMKLANDHYLQIRYEELADDPRRTVAKVLDHVGLTFEEQQLAFGAYPHHTLGGNRLRLRGAEPIQKDTRYMKNISLYEWWVGSLMAWRHLKTFGYRMRR
ncbi:MAG: sulfotransferase [Ardenticatenaceae bacterium]